MKGQDRRDKIAKLLMSQNTPVSGACLSDMFGVSRQIIVKDISLLRDEGYEILSAHNGYLIQATPFFERIFKVYHTREQTEDELNTIVDLGGIVWDVYVRHKVYGKISAKLNISSRQDVRDFIDGVRTGKSTELMNITGGYHYHTVRALAETALDEIEDNLCRNGYLVERDTQTTK